MFEGLEIEHTKQRYKQILDDTIEIVDKKLVNDPNNDLWVGIAQQLNDIRHNIVEERNITEWTDIYTRYNIGRIAIQSFDPQDEMYKRLNQIFYGAVHFDELK